ncbi:MAG: hypothetical protein IKB70_00375 [Bacilli bacterium]|nr:hypothetical protein [Bacilli bacterium]
MSIQITQHFSLDELTTTDRVKFKDKNYQYGLSKITQMNILAHFAEQVRLVVGCPMKITSGIRCEELNAVVGGSKTSQHLKGEAIDFIPTKIKIKTAFDKIKKSNLEFGQLIIENDGKSEWLHISIGHKKQILRAIKLSHQLDSMYFQMFK